ncbi:MAG: hypothetical protein ACO3LE_10665 [Bdellovibrionota bacterium]
MILLTIVFWAFSPSQPVIQLDEVLIRSDMKRPKVHEIKARDMRQAIEMASLFNFQKLEQKLLEPLTLEVYRESKKSAK